MILILLTFSLLVVFVLAFIWFRSEISKQSNIDRLEELLIKEINNIKISEPVDDYEQNKEILQQKLWDGVKELNKNLDEHNNTVKSCAAIIKYSHILYNLNRIRELYDIQEIWKKALQTEKSQ